MHLDLTTVADSLRKKSWGIAWIGGDSRVSQYRHVLYEAMNWGRR